jgi:competence protein ComEA
MKKSEDHASEQDFQQKLLRIYRRNLVVVGIVSTLVGMLIGVFGIAAGLGLSHAPLTPPPDWGAVNLPTENHTASTRSRSLSVYVSGAVRTPQVVTLTAGSLVVDALDAAGGPSPDADLEAINLAAPLANHQQIVIPHRITRTHNVQQADSATTESRTSSAHDRQGTRGGGSPDGETGPESVNINTATAEALEQLPRIGPTLAERIIAYREENGGFGTVQDIQNVPGIGEGTFAYIEPYITVGP